MRKKREIAANTTDSKTSRNAAVPAAPAAGSPQETAGQVMTMLDQIEGLVPGFVHHDTNEALRVASGARFAYDLIPQVITTVTALPPVGGVNTFDVDAGRAALAFGDAWQPIVQRLSTLLDGVQFTIDTGLAKSARQALSTYAWAKKHARGPEGVALRPYLDEMTRTMKRTLNHRKASASEPAPSSPPAPAGAQGFLAPNPAQARAGIGEDDLPEDFREALEEAVKE